MSSTATTMTSAAGEIALRVAVPVLSVWFGLVMGALNGSTPWTTAIAVPTFVTAMLVAHAARRVARGERRFTRG